MKQPTQPPPASKDDALRAAIQIVASSYSTRGGHEGDEITKVLELILLTAKRMDEAMEEE